MRIKIVSLAIVAIVVAIGAVVLVTPRNPVKPEYSSQEPPVQADNPEIQISDETEPERRATNPAQSRQPGLRGLLIDGRNDVVPDGDVLYKFIPRPGQSCDPDAELDFNLGPDTRIVYSGSNGRFDIPLPEGRDVQQNRCLLLNASKQGYTGSLFVLDLDLHAGIIELELERHQTIRGEVVTPDGKVIAGATVKSWIAANGEPDNDNTRLCDSVDSTSLVSGNSVGNGTFKLDVAGDNQFCLQASHPEWASSVASLIDSKETSDREFVLTLEVPAQFTGHVVDQEGIPVANLPLQLLRGDAAPRVSATDSAGAFIFRHLDTADYQLRSGDDAYAVASPREIVVKRGESPSGVEVSVFPVSTISGRLVDDRGNPLAGAQIAARSPYLPDLSATSTISNDSGYFEIRSEHRSKAVHDMHRMATAFVEQAEPAQDFAPVVCLSFYHPRFRGDELSITTSEASFDVGTVYMEAPLIALEGVVKNHRDEVIEAELTFNYIDSNRHAGSDPPGRCEDSTTPRVARADSQGQFALHLDQTGRYEVEVKTDRYKTRQLEIDVSGSSDEIEIRLN